MVIQIRALWAAFSLIAASNAAAQVRLLHPADNNAAAAAQATSPSQSPLGPAHRVVALDAAMYTMHAGDEAAVEAPNGVTYVLTYSRTETGFGGGSVWVGHVRGYGTDYPALISTYAGQVNGSIATPDGKLRLQGTEAKSVLTDVQAANEHLFVPTMDDAVPAPRRAGSIAPGGSGSAPTAVSPAASGSTAQIDMLILFTTQLQTQLGGYSATIARLNLLVATANNVYVNSGIHVSLNLVYAQAVNYSYDTADDTIALSSMQSDTTVAALRDQYGADVVALLRPFQTTVCGLSYQTQDFTYPDYAFSVVEDGTSGNFYCDVTTLTHEVGHLMGAAHDAATSISNNASPDGTPSYNRGYCNGNAGTVMSYSSTSGCGSLVPYFSNPALNSCNSRSCGVPIGSAYTVSGTTISGADSTTAINANAPALAAWRTPPSKFTSLVPSRVLDTRAGSPTGDGLFSGTGALSAGGQIDVGIAGRGGVPAIGAGAVVLNVTATNPSSSGYVTAWPTGMSLPYASNINFTPGQTIPNLVVAKLGSSGKVSLYNAIGTTDLIADVAGWFPSTSSFSPLVPSRILDTRTSQSIPGGTELDFAVAGRGGVPSSGVGAVVLNLTVTGPTAPGYLTAWPAGTALPNASNLNFVPGQTVANLAIVKVGANGNVALFNSSGNTNVVADVAGWFPTASELTSMVPARLLDTRPGMATIDGQYAGTGAVGPTGELDFTVTGRAGIPASGVGAVVLNVAAVSPSAPGYLTVWPAGSTLPFASNLNFTPGAVVQNLVVAKVGSNGEIAIFNSAGSTHVIADVVGWFSANP